MRDEELALQETAEAAEQARNYAAAFDAWHRLASMTSRPDYLCKAGRAAAKLRRWADAEKAFLDALTIDNPFPLAKLERMRKKLGPWTDGEGFLDALKDGKPFPLAMVFLGSLFLARTDRDPAANARTAKAWLEKAFAAAPGPMSLSLLGSAHVRLGEREAAKEAFRKAIELDESYAEAYFNLGLLLANDGKNEEAEDFSEKQRSWTQILAKRTEGSELSSKNSENLLRPRMNSGALSSLTLLMQSPVSISIAP